MSKEAAAESDVFAAAAARKRALAAELSGRPVEDVIGLVDARGAGGWCEEGDQWTLHFAFHSWKVPSGPINSRPLSVSKTTSRSEFDVLWTRVESYAVFRIRARIAEQSMVGTPQAELVEFLGPDGSDSEMNQAAIDFRKPVIHEDHQFGRFTLDRRVNWHTAKVAWNGVVVELERFSRGCGDVAAMA